MVRTRLPTTKKKKHCLLRLAKSSNGAATCDGICEDRYWYIVPTISGDIWEPKRPRGRPMGGHLGQYQPRNFVYGIETWQQSPLADLDR
jgi:hypothetical protein